MLYLVKTTFYISFFLLFHDPPVPLTTLAICRVMFQTVYLIIMMKYELRNKCWINTVVMIQSVLHCLCWIFYFQNIISFLFKKLGWAVDAVDFLIESLGMPYSVITAQQACTTEMVKLLNVSIQEACHNTHTEYIHELWWQLLSRNNFPQ